MTTVNHLLVIFTAWNFIGAFLCMAYNGADDGFRRYFKAKGWSYEAIEDAGLIVAVPVLGLLVLPFWVSEKVGAWLGDRMTYAACEIEETQKAKESSHE